MFDVREVKADDFGLLKDGHYPATFIKAEIKKTKAGIDFINLTLQIIAGEYKNRQIFLPVYYKAATPEGVASAMKKIKNVLDSIGSKVFEFADEQRLFAAILYKQVNIKVGIESSEGFPDKNVIRYTSKYVGEVLDIKTDAAIDAIPF